MSYARYKRELNNELQHPVHYTESRFENKRFFFSFHSENLFYRFWNSNGIQTSHAVITV